MNDTIALTKTALVNLIGLIFNPNPDDPGNPRDPFGPFGPGGPVIRDLMEVLNLTARLKPPPFPWRSMLDAHAVIEQAFTQFQFAEISANGEQAEKAMSMARLQIQSFVDDYCGNGIPKWPKPRMLDRPKLEPVDLLVAGVQFQKMADLATENPLQQDLAQAAEKMIEVGLKRLS